jgi:hypothetical protein
MRVSGLGTVLLLSLASTAAWAQGSIRDTAWNERVYEFEDRTNSENGDVYEVALSGGRADEVTIDGRVHPMQVSLFRVVYGNYLGDRRLEAVVVLAAREDMSAFTWEASFVLLFQEGANGVELVNVRRAPSPERVTVSRRIVEVRARRGIDLTPYPCIEWLEIIESGLRSHRRRCR